jgi:hypothetical protein
VSLKKSELFFAHENIKNLPSEVAVWMFFLCSPNCPKRPKTEFSYFHISSLICDLNFFFPLKAQIRGIFLKDLTICVRMAVKKVIVYF